MTRLIALAAALALSACASVQAKSQEGKGYTCVPNDARDRGPFQATPPAGARLTVKGDGADVKIATHQ